MMTRVFVYEYISGDAHEAEAWPELLPQGRAMRDAMVADLGRIDDVMIGCAVLPAEQQADCFGAQNVAYCRRKPGESTIDFVRRQSQLHDVSWVVAPECDGILLNLQAAVGDARWLGCSAPAIARAGSKCATAQWLGNHGIAATRPWREGEPPDPDCRQWVVKPDDGAGASATWSYHQFEAARIAYLRRRADGETAVLEPWVEGEPLSVSLLCGAAGAEVLSINRQRIHIDDAGQVHYDGVQIQAVAQRCPQGRALARLGRRVAAALPGLRGFVGIDVVWHPLRGPVVIEVNPRVTSAYVGMSASLGRNLAREMLADHQIGSEIMETNGTAHGG